MMKNAIRESPKAHWTKVNSCSPVISLMRKRCISSEVCFQISYSISRNLAFRFHPFLLCRVKWLVPEPAGKRACPNARMASASALAWIGSPWEAAGFPPQHTSHQPVTLGPGFMRDLWKLNVDVTDILWNESTCGLPKKYSEDINWRMCASGKASLIETLGTVQGIRLCEIASLQSLTFLARGKFVWGFKKRYFSVEYNGASVEGRSEHFTISAHIFFTHCHWFWSFSLRSRAVTSSGYHSFYHICNNSAISSRNICKKLYRHYFTRSYSPPKKLMHVSFLII